MQTYLLFYAIQSSEFFSVSSVHNYTSYVRNVNYNNWPFIESAPSPALPRQHQINKKMWGSKTASCVV